MVIVLLEINCDIVDKMMPVKSLTASSGVEFSKIASQLVFERVSLIRL